MKPIKTTKRFSQTFAQEIRVGKCYMMCLFWGQMLWRVRMSLINMRLFLILHHITHNAKKANLSLLKIPPNAKHTHYAPRLEYPLLKRANKPTYTNKLVFLKETMVCVSIECHKTFACTWNHRSFVNPYNEGVGKLISLDNIYCLLSTPNHEPHDPYVEDAHVLSWGYTFTFDSMQFDDVGLIL